MDSTPPSISPGELARATATDDSRNVVEPSSVEEHPVPSVTEPDSVATEDSKRKDNAEEERPNSEASAAKSTATAASKKISPPVPNHQRLAFFSKSDITRKKHPSTTTTTQPDAARKDGGAVSSSSQADPQRLSFFSKSDDKTKKKTADKNSVAASNVGSNSADSTSKLSFFSDKEKVPGASDAVVTGSESTVPFSSKPSQGGKVLNFFSNHQSLQGELSREASVDATHTTTSTGTSGATVTTSSTANAAPRQPTSQPGAYAAGGFGYGAETIDVEEEDHHQPEVAAGQTLRDEEDLVQARPVMEDATGLSLQEARQIDALAQEHKKRQRERYGFLAMIA